MSFVGFGTNYITGRRKMQRKIELWAKMKNPAVETDRERSEHAKAIA